MTKFQPIVISSIRTKAEVDGLVGGVRHCPFFLPMRINLVGAQKTVVQHCAKAPIRSKKGVDAIVSDVSYLNCLLLACLIPLST